MRKSLIGVVLVGLLIAAQVVAAGAVCSNQQQLAFRGARVAGTPVIRDAVPLQKICVRGPFFTAGCKILVKNFLDEQRGSQQRCVDTMHFAFFVSGPNGSPFAVPGDQLLQIAITATDENGFVVRQTFELGEMERGVPFEDALYPEFPANLERLLVSRGFEDAETFYTALVQNPARLSCSRETKYSVEVSGTIPGCGQLATSWRNLPGGSASEEVPWIEVPRPPKVPIYCSGNGACPDYTVPTDE